METNCILAHDHHRFVSCAHLNLLHQICYLKNCECRARNAVLRPLQVLDMNHTGLAGLVLHCLHNIHLPENVASLNVLGSQGNGKLVEFLWTPFTLWPVTTTDLLQKTKIISE